MRRLLPLLLLSLALPSSADDTSEPAHRERWTFTRDWSLDNAPEKNTFATKGTGELSIHDGRVFEQHRSETRLTQARLKGMPMPLPMLPANMREWKGETEFERLDRAALDATTARALGQLFVDHRLIDTLARRCRHDWKAIAAASEKPPAPWSPAARYAALTFVRKGDTVRITAGGRGGGRALTSFVFEGVLDGERFRSITYTGTVVNRAKKITTRVAVTMTRTAREPVADARYRPALDAIARVVSLAAKHELAAALAVKIDAPEPLVAGVAALRTQLEARKASVAWVRRLRPSAFARAGKEGKPLVVVFEQDGCPGCNMLQSAVVDDRTLARHIDGRFVPVLVNVNTHPGVYERFGLAGTPTVLVLDAEGTELARGQGAFMVPRLKSILDKGLEAFARRAEK